MSSDDNFITILTPISETKTDVEMRGIVESIKTRLNLTSISARTLSESTRAFFGSIREVLDATDAELLNYQLDEIELTATITTEGKLTLVAGEMGGSFQGGIKFRFTRADNKSKLQ